MRICVWTNAKHGRSNPTLARQYAWTRTKFCKMCQYYLTCSCGLDANSSIFPSCYLSALEACQIRTLFDTLGLTHSNNWLLEAVKLLCIITLYLMGPTTQFYVASSTTAMLWIQNFLQRRHSQVVCEVTGHMRLSEQTFCGIIIIIIPNSDSELEVQQ